MARAVAVEVAQLGDRHVVPGKAHAHAAGGGALVAVAIGAVAERLGQGLLFGQERRRAAVNVDPHLVG